MKVAGVKWDYDRSEMIADAIVHGIGLSAALVGVTALIFYATVWSTSGQLAAASIYGGGLIAALSISFVYNLFPVGRAKWFLRRLDHSGIFVLIAATYTPFLQRGWDDPFLFSMLVAIWLIAAAGIAMKCLLPGRFDRLAILLYLAMGWSGLLAAKSLFTALSATTLTLISSVASSIRSGSSSMSGSVFASRSHLARLRRHGSGCALFRSLACISSAAVS